MNVTRLSTTLPTAIRTGLLLAAVCLSVTSFTSHSAAQTLSQRLRAEPITALAKDAMDKGSAVKGAVLFPRAEMGCANCHSAGNASLLGPDLSRMGERATAVYLVESLLHPSKSIGKGFESVSLAMIDGRVLSGRIVEEKDQTLVLRRWNAKQATAAGELITLARGDVAEVKRNANSLMPENVTDQLADRQQFLDLVRYLSELAAAGPVNTPPHSVANRDALSDKLRGLLLMDQLQCAACHQSEIAPNDLPARQAPLLSNAGGRIDPDYLEQFIESPASVKPATNMPNMLARLSAPQRRQTARAITHFLVSLSRQSAKQSLPASSEGVGRGAALFHSIGCVACHSPRDENGRELLTGASTSLHGVERKYSLSGLTSFLENPHATRPAGRMPNMKLTHWEAVDLASYLLQHKPARTSSETSFTPDPKLAKQGRMDFLKLGCASCHSGEPTFDSANRPLQRRPLNLTSLANKNSGCLSGKLGNWPAYQLDDSQRRLIGAAIESATQPLTTNERINLTLGAFNCLACHQRGGLGGVSAERDAFFHTSNQNLGPQGRLPPSLTSVGAKLKPNALRQVLIGGSVARPYMATRMPQFTADNVSHLVDLFAEADKAPATKFARFKDQKEIRITGADMAGNRGLNCIACHTFQQKPAQTMPAIDLTLMSSRLQKSWFYQYMRNPQAFNRGTVMPSFWPRGHAMRKDILNGDADLQIEALWQYLLDGRQARTPRGLIVKPIELVAAKEAVMLRRSYPGIGKRGIGVGYPKQVNLAFDAEQMRLAMIWKGKFADPGGVWRGQGHGIVRPLSRDPIRFATGPELDDLHQPWKVDKGRPPNHKFRGYFLDDQQRPTFMYRFEHVDVTDYPMDVDVPNAELARLRRTLTFQSPTRRGDLVFRAATGRKILRESNGDYRVDKRLRIRIVSGQAARIDKLDDAQQLRIPLTLDGKKESLVLEYEW